MENDKKNQNTTRALPHAFKLRVLPLSRYIRLITRTTNKVTRQLWRSLENYETVKKLSMKTIFQSSFSVGKYFRTKIQSIFLIYSIENSIFFNQCYETCIPWWQRNVYEWASVWEHFRFFSEEPTRPVFCHLWLRTVWRDLVIAKDLSRMYVAWKSQLPPSYHRQPKLDIRLHLYSVKYLCRLTASGNRKRLCSIKEKFKGFGLR